MELAAPAIWAAVFIKFLAALLRKDEKHKDRRAIDFKFATVIMPIVLIGAFWGEVIHGTVAPIISATALALVIGYLLFKIFVAIVKEYRAHVKQMTKINVIAKDEDEANREMLRSRSESVISQEIIDNMTIATSIIDSKGEIRMPSDDIANMFAINIEEVMTRSSASNVTEDSLDSINPQYDNVYTPRYFKRAIPILIMIILLSKNTIFTKFSVSTFAQRE